LCYDGSGGSKCRSGFVSGGFPARERERKSPPTPDPAEKFAKQAHDLDAVRKTVEDAASVSTGIWLSYIFVLFYIGIAAPLPTNSARKPSQTTVSE
jgi:hypothetical protein